MEQIPAWFKNGDWLRAKIASAGEKTGMVQKRGLAPSQIASAGEKTRFGEVPVPVF